MESYKNKKNLLSSMKQILSLLLLFSIMIFSTNAVLFEDDQTNIYEFLQTNELIGSIQNEVLFNTTLSDTFKLTMTTKPILVAFYSQTGLNETINLGYSKIGGGFISDDYTIIAGENNYFLFTPQYEGEYVDILLTGISGQMAYSLEIINDNSRENGAFNNLFSPFILGVSELITITTTFWRVLFYIFVVGIGLLVVFGFFYSGFKLIQWSKKLEKSNGITGED